MIKLNSGRNIDQALHTFKDYAKKVDVDFVRKVVLVIGCCTIKLERDVERCITSRSIYHCVKTTQKTEDKEYADAGEQGYSDSPALVAESGASPPSSTANARHPTARQPAAPAALALPDLLDLGMDNNNSAIVSVDRPATPANPPLIVVLPASSGQSLQINAQLVRRDRQVFYSMMFEKFLLMGS
ncbi:Beta-adaptin-like protein B [Capsicum baccatum]|uniref:Beta-adaptin-like protein B n=1 Tax=Capsicum baccatum TaxID=33114 RepID=A0A2G2X2I3_CAPBA|nr:Beta-adaptin-like protein B [Capsicum baccatum]